MKAEFINPAIDSLSRIVNEMIGVELKRGDLFIRKNPISLKRVIVVIGITGEIKGQIVVSLGIDSALNIASKMMMGMEVLELNELSKSAIGELGNMTAGNYATEIAKLGHKIDITAPIILCGTDMELSAYNQNQIAIPFISDLGEITMDISIKS